MTNQEFAYWLDTYHKDGLLQCLPKQTIRQGYIIQRVGKRFLFLHNSIASFADAIVEKNEDEQFFSQRELELFYNKTHSFVSGLVARKEYAMFIIDGVKFYVKKDWV